MVSLYFPVWALFGFRAIFWNLLIFLEFLLRLAQFLQIFFSHTHYFCFLLRLSICIGPFIASYVSCITSFLSSLLLFYVSFSPICWVRHTLPFLLMFCLLFCHNSFLFLFKVSVSVSSALFVFFVCLVVCLWVFLFCFVLFFVCLFCFTFVFLFIWCP